MNSLYEIIHNAELHIKYSEHELSINLTIPLTQREKYSKNIKLLEPHKKTNKKAYN